MVSKYQLLRPLKDWECGCNCTKLDSPIGLLRLGLSSETHCSCIAHHRTKKNFTTDHGTIGFLMCSISPRVPPRIPSDPPIRQMFILSHVIWIAINTVYKPSLSLDIHTSSLLLVKEGPQQNKQNVLFQICKNFYSSLLPINDL